MKYNDICPVSWQLNMMRLISKMYLENNFWNISSNSHPRFCVLCTALFFGLTLHTTASAQNDLTPLARKKL